MKRESNAAYSWVDIFDEQFPLNVLEALHEPLIVCNAEGKIVYINPAYENELHTKLTKIRGRKIGDIAPYSLIAKVLASGRPILRKAYRVPKTDRDVIVSCTPIYKENILIGAVSVFKNISEIKLMSKELDRIRNYTDYLQEQLDLKIDTREVFKTIIGNNNKNFRNIMARATQASKSDVTVLLGGETGTGKDLFARAIHNASKRKKNPFIEINCAAIPENLLESELFGYESGAFTGARKGGKLGKFQLADRGTLFLDEIGDLSLVLQAKLLRALQEKRFERVGGTKSINIDVRIIAATNKDLKTKIAHNEFREDLFYRLNVFSINMIPLRNRREDIPLLCSHFLKKFSEKEGKMVKLSAPVLHYFLNYDWPGNIRELQNAIESAIVSCEHNFLEIEDLPDYMRILETNKREKDILITPSRTSNIAQEISQVERGLIIQSLNKTGNNRSKAAKMLGWSRTTLYNKLLKYGIKFNIINLA